MNNEFCLFMKWQSACKVENDRENKKCNTLNNNNNNTLLDARKTRTRVIGGYDSMREGDKGISLLLHIIFTHPLFSRKRGVM
jgi:hypothetical protein